MIDFTGVSAIHIPEGNVVKIENATGVLWEKPMPGGLPTGYTLLEYLESSGTQYINTGFKPNNNTGVVATVKFQSVPKAHAGLFGSRTAAEKQYWCYYRYNDLTFATRYGTRADIKIAATSTNKTVVEQNKNALIVNGETVSASAQTFTGEYEMYIFSVNQSGATQYTSSFRLYACEIYDNGTLIRDYVPCINPSGAYGLYDRVNGEFYGNAGTGAFTGAVAA